MIGESVY